MIFAVGFVLRRSAVVLGFELADGGVPPAIAAGYALQLAAGLLAGLGVCLEQAWTRVALLALGGAVAATLVAEVALTGAQASELVSGAAALAVTAVLYAVVESGVGELRETRER